MLGREQEPDLLLLLQWESSLHPNGSLDQMFLKAWRGEIKHNLLVALAD